MCRIGVSCKSEGIIPFQPDKCEVLRHDEGQCRLHFFPVSWPIVAHSDEREVCLVCTSLPGMKSSQAEDCQ